MVERELRRAAKIRGMTRSKTRTIALKTFSIVSFVKVSLMFSREFDYTYSELFSFQHGKLTQSVESFPHSLAA